MGCASSAPEEGKLSRKGWRDTIESDCSVSSAALSVSSSNPLFASPRRESEPPSESMVELPRSDSFLEVAQARADARAEVGVARARAKTEGSGSMPGPSGDSVFQSQLELMRRFYTWEDIPMEFFVDKFVGDDGNGGKLRSRLSIAKQSRPPSRPRTPLPPETDEDRRQSARRRASAKRRQSARRYWRRSADER